MKRQKRKPFASTKLTWRIVDNASKDVIEQSTQKLVGLTAVWRDAMKHMKGDGRSVQIMYGKRVITSKSYVPIHSEDE